MSFKYSGENMAKLATDKPPVDEAAANSHWIGRERRQAAVGEIAKSQQ
jgi:hypothetical protein